MSFPSGSEYASYIALCRELRLEREFEEGDHFACAHPGHPTIGAEMCGHYEPYHSPPTAWPEDHLENWWLPRLDQLLAMLEAAGWTKFEVWRDYLGDWHAMTSAPASIGRASTREEAALRLWMAVTGRTVRA